MLMLAVVFVAGVAGCGSDSPEPDGSWGQSETNNIVTLSLTPDTKEVDVCDPMAYSVSADLINTVINPSLPENSLFLEEYAVYFRGITNGAPPLASIGENIGGTLPATGLGTSFVDAGMQDAFLNDIVSGAYTPDESFPQYSASYVFSGTDLHGSNWGVSGEFSFKMGRYSSCPAPAAPDPLPALGVLPSSITLTGIANPDASTTDDVIFKITGGAPPYSVYSDTPAVILAQGALANGVSSLTVDPDSVSVETTVSLNVYDSAGASVVVEVTVTPDTGSQLSVLPSSIALTGLADTSDEIEFHISGGVGPYSVVSDDDTVIAHPGLLGIDVTSFIVNPKLIFSDTVVTLSVQDSVGAKAEAVVTVLSPY